MPKRKVKVSARKLSGALGAARSRAAGPGALDTDVVSVEVPRFTGHDGGHELSVAVPMHDVTYTSSAGSRPALKTRMSNTEISFVLAEERIFIRAIFN